MDGKTLPNVLSPCGRYRPPLTRVLFYMNIKYVTARQIILPDNVPKAIQNKMCILSQDFFQKEGASEAKKHTDFLFAN